MKKGTNLTRSAYARHRGVHESAVRKALREDRIELEPDGKIDPKKADKQWEENSDPTQVSAQNDGKKSGSRGGMKFQDARAQKEEFAARLKELEYETLIGRLVPIDHVRHVMTNQYAICKAKLLTIPVKVAARAAALSKPAEIQALIRTEILEALHELVGIEGKAELPVGDGGDVGSPKGRAKTTTGTNRVKVGRSKSKAIG